MTKKLENHIIFLVLLIITAAHLYFVLPHYMGGYDRFIEIWSAIPRLLKFLVMP